MTTANTSILSGTLIAALATVGVCDVAFGLSLQLQPLIMEARGIPAWLIGLNSAAGALGVLIAGPLLPRIIAKFGGRRVAFAAIVAIAICLAAMAALSPPWWWLPLRLVFGAAVGTLFTVSETWVLTVATNENRGRMMGIYTAMLSVTFAVGPIIVPFTGIHGFLPWGIGICFMLLGLVALLFVRIRDVSEDGGHGNIFAVLGRAPVLFACIAAATIFDSVIISFFSIFATRNGVTLGAASFMLAAGIVAGVVFFYPLGLWADRWSKNGVVVICTVGTVLSCLLLAPLINTLFVWPLVILIFTAAFGVYVVALAIIGDVFKGRDMVAASAAVAAMWGLGGIVGPPIAGWMIDNFGINSFPFTLSGFYAVLLAGLLSQGGRVTRPV